MGDLIKPHILLVYILKMAENLALTPKRGILKPSKSFEERKVDGVKRNITLDESNILLTLHPENKDYGLMKIDEAKTPYHVASDDEDDEDAETDEESDVTKRSSVDPKMLSDKLAAERLRLRRYSRSPSADKEDLELLSPEEKERRKQFELKRKAHYKEYYAVKVARELMESDEDSEKEEGG